MALRKRDAAIVESQDQGALARCRLAEAFPQLIEFLVATRYEDGSPRVLPSLTIFYDAAALKACLNDRDQGLVAFISAASLTGLLEALEAGLSDDTLDWRLSQTSSSKRSRKT